MIITFFNYIETHWVKSVLYPSFDSFSSKSARIISGSAKNLRGGAKRSSRLVGNTPQNLVMV